MRATLLVPILVVAAFVAAPASACGEGIFSMGEGLRYDGYLAPRPATVLVYEPDGDATPERIAVYRGLARAGHKVTVVTDRLTTYGSDTCTDHLSAKRWSIASSSVRVSVFTPGRGLPSLSTLPSLCAVW